LFRVNPLNYGLQNLASETRNITLSWGVEDTNRQTDGLNYNSNRVYAKIPENEFVAAVLEVMLSYVLILLRN